MGIDDEPEALESGIHLRVVQLGDVEVGDRGDDMAVEGLIEQIADHARLRLVASRPHIVD